MSRQDRSTCGEDDELELGWAAEAPAQLGERRTRGGVGLFGRPEPTRRGVQGAGADHERLGAGAQEAHQEPVARAAAGDQLVRLAERRDRGHAVGGLNEVREGSRGLEPNRSAVVATELVGQLERGQAGRLVEQLERRRNEPH